MWWEKLAEIYNISCAQLSRRNKNEFEIEK